MTKKVEKTTKKAVKKSTRTRKAAPKKQENSLVMELREHGKTSAQRFVFTYKGKTHRSRGFAVNNKKTADAFKVGLVAWLKDQGVRNAKAEARKIWLGTKVELYVPQG